MARHHGARHARKHKSRKHHRRHGRLTPAMRERAERVASGQVRRDHRGRFV
jgi:hypothetical protein